VQEVRPVHLKQQFAHLVARFLPSCLNEPCWVSECVRAEMEWILTSKSNRPEPPWPVSSTESRIVRLFFMYRVAFTCSSECGAKKTGPSSACEQASERGERCRRRGGGVREGWDVRLRGERGSGARGPQAAGKTKRRPDTTAAEGPLPPKQQNVSVVCVLCRWSCRRNEPRK
jgi:hypothetical protein